VINRRCRDWLRIGIRIRQKDADPTVSGSTTLLQRLFNSFFIWQVWAGDQQEVPGLLEAGQKADRGPQNILARALEHAAKNDTLNISKTKRLEDPANTCLFCVNTCPL
jgi:hypothetical protein